MTLVLIANGRGEFRQSEFCSHEVNSRGAFCFVLCLQPSSGTMSNQNIPAIDGVSKVLPRTVRRHLVATLKKRTYKPDVTEVYSPPRVTKRASRHGLLPRRCVGSIDRVGSVKTRGSTESTRADSHDQTCVTHTVTTVHSVLSIEKFVQFQTKPGYSPQRRAGRNTSC